MKKLICKKTVAFALMFATIVSWVPAGAVSLPEEWYESQPSGAEITYNPTLAGSADATFEQVEPAPSARSIEELKAIPGVKLDECGNILSVRESAANQMTSEELSLLFGSSAPLQAQVSPEEMLREQFDLSADEAARGIERHGSLWAYQTQLSSFRLAESAGGFDANTCQRVLLLISGGYTLSQALAANVAADIMGLSMEELMEAKAAEIEKTQQTEETERDSADKRSIAELQPNPEYEEFAIHSGLPYTILAQRLQNTDGSLESLRIAFDDARTAAYTRSESAVEPAAAMMAATDPLTYVPEKILEKPFTYNSMGAMDINVNTGSYSYTETDLSIPGVNGLNLNITRAFSTNMSDTKVRMGYRNIGYENKIVIRVGYKYYRRIVSSSGVELIEITDFQDFVPTDSHHMTLGKNYTALEFDEAINRKKYLDTTEGWSIVGNRNRPGDEAWALPVIMPYEPNFSAAFVNVSDVPYDFTVKEYGLGHGWRLGLSAIEEYYTGYDFDNPEMEKRLVTADGRQYKIEPGFTEGASNLVDHPLCDLQLQDATNSDYPNAKHKLLHADGKVEYFDSKGRNIAIVDRFGNTIRLAYTVENGYVTKIEITDTLGNIVIYKDEKIDSSGSYSIVGSPAPSQKYNRLWTLALNGQRIRSYYISENTTARRLLAIGDENNIITTYSTDAQYYSYNCFTTVPATSDARLHSVKLTEVKYPNGLEQRLFTVSGAHNREKLGGLGYTETVRASSVLQYARDADGKVRQRSQLKYAFAKYSSDHSGVVYPLSYESTYSVEVSETIYKHFNPQYIPYPVQTAVYTFAARNHTCESVKQQVYEPVDYDALTLENQFQLVPEQPKGTIRETAYIYNSNHLPINITTVEYDLPKLTSRTTRFRYTYDNRGNVLTETLPNEQVITRTYDPNYSIPITTTYKQKYSITIVETNTLAANNKSIEKREVTSNGTLQAKSVYLYDSKGRVTNQKDYITASSYAERVIAYGTAADPTEIKLLNVLTAAGGSAQSTPGYAAGTLATKISYNNRGWPVGMTDANGNTQSIAYDTAGRVTRVTSPDQTYASYDYDVLQNTVTYTDACGTRFLYQYSPTGDLLSVTDILSGQILSENLYDGANRLVRSTVHSSFGEDTRIYYVYDSLSRVIAAATKNTGGAVTSKESYQYLDGSGKVIHTALGDADAPSVVSATYTNTMGNVVKTERTSDSSSNADIYSYDYLGNVTEAVSAYTTSRGGLYTTRSTYDWAGRVLTAQNALGQTVKQTYDWLGNPLTSTDPAGTVTQQRYDVAGRLLEIKQPFDATRTATTRYVYDPAGNVREESSDTGVRKYEYDNRGRLTKSDAGEGITARYTYDALGNIETLTTGNNAVTRYGYDRFGRLETLTDALGQTERYTYDLNGTVRTKTDRNGNVTTYRYDNLARVIQATVQTRDGTNFLTRAYTLTGQLRSESSGSATTTYRYDGLGRLSQETTGTDVKSYGYNRADLRVSFTLTTNGTQQMSNTYGYDELGRLTKVTGSGVTAEYEYDVNGNRKSQKNGGLVVDYIYNKANLVTRVTNWHANLGTIYSKYDYTYYLDGNQQTKTDYTGKTTTYTYNTAGALKKEEERQGGSLLRAYAYEYDAANNRTKLTATGAESYTTSYAYDANSRLLTETRVSGAATTAMEYHYDPNGNLYSSVRSTLKSAAGTIPALKPNNSLDGVTIYGYDGFNQQTSVEMAGMKASYAYLPNGLRQSKTVNGATTGLIWDGSQTVAERAGSAITMKYVRGANLIASVEGATTSYYLHNAHGDVVHITNRNGALIKNYTYDAFGVEQNPDSADTNPFRYCGEYFDAETGSVYLRARYYQPGTGRFTSEDPIRDGLNWYAYCRGNPVMFFDPSGLAPGDWFTSMDKAAEDFGEFINKDSIDNNWEYGSQIYKIIVDGSTYYSYLDPYTDKNSHQVNHKYYLAENGEPITVEGDRIVAFAHTHGAYTEDKFSEQFSQADLNSLKMSGIRAAYVATPGGKLLKAFRVYPSRPKTIADSKKWGIGYNAVSESMHKDENFRSYTIGYVTTKGIKYVTKRPKSFKVPLNANQHYIEKDVAFLPT